MRLRNVRHSGKQSNGDHPLLSVMHGLVERWGLPAIVMCLGDMARSYLKMQKLPSYTNQRGLILGAVQVCQLSDQMHAEMEFISTT